MPDLRSRPRARRVHFALVVIAAAGFVLTLASAIVATQRLRSFLAIVELRAELQTALAQLESLSHTVMRAEMAVLLPGDRQADTVAAGTIAADESRAYANLREARRMTGTLASEGPVLDSIERLVHARFDAIQEARELIGTGHADVGRARLMRPLVTAQRDTFDDLKQAVADRGLAVLDINADRGRQRFLETLALSIAAIALTVLIGGVVIALLTWELRRRRLAEEEVSEREERYRVTFENVGIGLAHGTESGEWLWVNEQLCEFLGYTRAELQRLNFRDFTHPDDIEDDADRIKQLCSGVIRRYSITKRYIRKDGGVVWAVLTVSAAQRSGIKARRIIYSVLDLTTQMRAYEEVRRTSQLLSAIIRDAPVAIVTLDRAHRVQTWNPAAEEIFGWQEGELVDGALPWDGDVGDKIRRGIDTLTATGTSVSRLRGQRPRKDGQVREIELSAVPLRDEHGVVDGVVALLLDRTEEVNAERHFHAEAMRNRTLLEGMPVLVGQLDADGRYVFVNRAYREFLGKMDVEILGRPLVDVIGIGSAGVALEGLQRARNGDLAACENSLVDSHGRTRTVVASYFPLETEDGQSTFEVTTDVTDVRELTAQLRHALKMEAIGQLAGGIAHDFNNMLTAVMGYGRFVMDGLSANDSQLKSFTAEILATADRAAKLTRQLLAFGRRQVFHLQPIDVGFVVRDLQRMLQPIVGERVRITVACAVEHPMVLADEGQLQQVVVNLAVNARDAMPNGGELRVTVRERELVERTRVGGMFVEAGKFIELEVADEGAGIPPEILSKIYEPFFTTKGKGEGTGLGLSTVHGIVSQLNGVIDVESTVGRGTTFRILLPILGAAPVAAPVAAPADDAEAALSSPASLAGESTRLRIVVAEQNPMLRGIMERILRDNGYDVCACATGDEVRDLIGSAADTVDLIISDVTMPRLGGKALLAWLDSVELEIPVVLTTSNSHDALSADRRDWNNVEFLDKPFVARQLLGVVARWLGEPRAGRRAAGSSM